MLNFLLALVHLDPLAMVQAGGYVGIALLVFAESGLLIGLFLPGDSLLFAAGLLAGGGVLAYAPLTAIVVVAAILCDTVGYWFGRKVGTALFSPPHIPANPAPPRAPQYRPDAHNGGERCVGEHAAAG